jgi:hypothetical protein
MDLYVDKRERVWLVDFNVFAPVTDALLFSWEDRRAPNPLLLVARPQQEQQQQQQEQEDEEMHGEVVRVVEVEEEEGGRDDITTFRVRGPFPSSSPSFLFRIVGSGSVSSGSGSGSSEGGLAVAPDPLSVYRAPLDLVALGGQLDMEELMRVTMVQRQERGDGDGDSGSSDGEEDMEAAAEGEAE